MTRKDLADVFCIAMALAVMIILCTMCLFVVLANLPVSLLLVCLWVIACLILAASVRGLVLIVASVRGLWQKYK